jgi:hypothetical protein
VRHGRVSDPAGLGPCAVPVSRSSTAMPVLKPYFLSTEDGKPRNGLVLDEFVRILFHQLLSEHQELATAKEATHVVALLHELFRQIGQCSGQSHSEMNRCVGSAAGSSRVGTTRNRAAVIRDNPSLGISSVPEAHPCCALCRYQWGWQSGLGGVHVLLY